MDVTELEFPQAVVARSHQVPVVVDFWAPWCAPCRSLGPILEREVAALGGRVELAKVDVDQAKRLAAKYGVMGIPYVVALRGGQVVAQFEGAHDAAFVRRWLAELSPSPSLHQLEVARTDAELLALLEDPEAGPGAALKLAERALATSRLEEATALLARVPARHELAPRARAVEALLGLAQVAVAAGGEAAARQRLEANPEDLPARYALACALAARGEDGPALEAFLAVVARDRTLHDDGARKAMLTLFERLGTSHEVTRHYRRQLQLVL
jgi:putative thioredoxin